MLTILTGFSMEYVDAIIPLKNSSIISEKYEIMEVEYFEQSKGLSDSEKTAFCITDF